MGIYFGEREIVMDKGSPDFEREKKRAEKLRNRLNIILLASVKNPILLKLQVKSTFTKRNVHEYDGLSGVLINHFAKGERVYFDIEGSGMLTLNGKKEFGLDHRHKDFKIPVDAERIEVDLTESGELGQHKVLRLPLRCVVYEREEGLYSLYNLFQVAVDTVMIEQRWEMLDRLDDALKSLPLLTVHPLSYLVHSDLFSKVLGEGLTNFDPYLHIDDLKGPEQIITAVDLSKALESIEKLLLELDELGKDEDRPEIVPLGNAHIDLVWLWPLAETEEKIRRTFVTVRNLMRYDNYTFVQSMVSHYEIIKRIEPEVYSDIKRLVSQGKWIPVGGMVVESDCNLIGGESLVRQILYGQEFFKEEFGRYSNIAWLPDTFGYTQQLPQILTKSGFELFVTTKFSYNDSTRFPHDIFQWKGPDGSTILAHAHMRDYISDIDMNSVNDTIVKNPESASIVKSVPIIYGFGDGGGGPTEEMLERMNFINRARRTFYFGRDPLEHWLSEVKKNRNRLSIIQGELYLEAHRGTYTTHGDIKKMNRRLETELFVAEAVSALGSSSPEKDIAKEWNILLKNQFHDMLPGSAIDEAYRVSISELNDLSDRLRKEYILTTCPADIEKGNFTIFSPYCWKTGGWVSLDESAKNSVVIDENGAEASVLNSGNGYGFYAEFNKGMGIYSFKLRRTEKTNESPSSAVSNPHNRWHIDMASGKLTSISSHGRYLPVPELALFNDFPYYFDAWELDDLERKHGHLLEPTDVSTSTLDGYGEVIDAKYDLNPGSITMRIVLPYLEEFVKVQFDVDWKGYNRLLRMFLKTGDGRCLAESAYSSIERRSEGPKYEFPVHRFIAVEGERGTFLLLNDSKYGYSYADGYIGASLLKSPFWPDPLSDRGKNSFSFSYRYVESRDPIDYTREAIKFNTPVYLVNKTALSAGKLLVEGAVLGSFKRAENLSGRILRLYNPSGETREFYVGFPFDIKNTLETDLLENQTDNENARLHKLDSRNFRGTIGPYEIRTIKVES